VFQRENVREIPLRVEDSPASQEITHWLEEELELSVPWKQGPMVRCTWIRHADQFHQLLVTFHHIIGDGISGVHFLGDLLRAISEDTEPGAQAANENCPETEQALPVSVDQRFPKLARGWRGVQCSLRTVVY